MRGVCMGRTTALAAGRPGQLAASRDGYGPEWRGRGAGSAVVEAVIAHVAEAGGGVLWCSARLGAVRFYERAGMVTRGDQWEEPFIGPHIAMYMMVPGPVEIAEDSE